MSIDNQSTFNFYRSLIEDIGLSHFFQGLPDVTVMKRMFTEFSRVAGCIHQFPDRETFAVITQVLTEEEPKKTLAALNDFCESPGRKNVDPTAAKSIKYFLERGSEPDTSIQEASKTELITIFSRGVEKEFSKLEEKKDDLLKSVSTFYSSNSNAVPEEKAVMRRELQSRYRQFLGSEGTEMSLPSREDLDIVCEALRNVDASHCKNRTETETLLRTTFGPSFRISNDVLSSTLRRIIVAVVNSFDDQNDYHFSKFSEIAKYQRKELKTLLTNPPAIFVKGIDVALNKRLQSRDVLARSFVDYFSLPAVSLILTLQTMVVTSQTR